MIEAHRKILLSTFSPFLAHTYKMRVSSSGVRTNHQVSEDWSQIDLTPVGMKGLIPRLTLRVDGALLNLNLWVG